MKLASFLTLALAACALVPAFAQNRKSPPPALPSGRIVNKLGNTEAWRIDFTYAKKQAGAPREGSQPVARVYEEPTSAILERKKTNWHVALLEKNTGQRIDYWADGKDVFCQTPESPRIRRASVYAPADSEDNTAAQIIAWMERRQFPNMEWLSKKTYQGTESVHSRDCWVFRKGDMTTWIDRHERVPVQWTQGGQTRIFTRLPSPKRIRLPPQAMAILRGIKKDREILNRPFKKGG